jgi:hypothetical protein
MSFEGDLDAFRQKLEQRRRDLFVGVAVACLQSIQTGHPVTAAPGQPVDTGALRASWLLNFESALAASITTNLAYAPAVEDGIGRFGPLTLRSQVGGFHSVKLTIAGFQALAEHVAQAMPE